MNLNTHLWKEFYIKDLFDVDMGNKFDKNKMTMNNPSINFVSRTGNNNGVDIVVDLIDDVNPYEAGSITLALGGSIGSCFVQTKPFYTGQNVAVLLEKEALSIYSKLFITSLIMNECKYKFVAFGRELNIHIKKDFSIFLPILRDVKDNEAKMDLTFKYSKDGYVPDFFFMENYIKTLHSKPITTAVKKNDEIGYERYGEFRVKDIFNVVNGKGITSEEIQDNPGGLYAVQSGAENNGCIGKIDRLYCEAMKYKIIDVPCLTVARTGTAGYVAYQPYGCVIGDSAKALILKENANVFVYLYIRTILMANKYKYAYGRKVITDKYMSEIIELPMTESGKPDYAYMERYMKNLYYSDRIV